ncbi:hypothetical protein FHS18_004064 [Paenibacillus phyllosphaerae]|uniref:Uncharacterized protein n=1 Tax=Paenibacillus phyllosphaerae TaxID=274593 RepID=A0A7W5B1K0_9BACL|nr:hypothetical protein [Paenibacillus phyllosphaerae]MBB3111996.1 hypothetical protein [Paenibacillus phyllosphaerae]
MILKKIDAQTANAIQSLLQQQNIHSTRILIDFEKRIVVSQDNDYSIDDLLEAAGSISPERGQELLKEVSRSREEWS